jgi:hypothetical protein
MRMRGCIRWTVSNHRPFLWQLQALTMPPLPITAGSAGAALASAIWVPNVEFTFGLTGATASVRPVVLGVSYRSIDRT